MRIVSLNISNILSIESATINFESNGLLLVEGWNYDDGKANGAGKTAIFNALSFGLYGQLPRRITASEILKKGSKIGFVEVVVDTGQDIFEVRRERPKKETFKKNGVVVTMSQVEFESIIKLSYDQFLVSMYTAQSTDSKFINLNDAGKKDFLLKLINLSDFAICKKEADEELKAIEKEIDIVNITLESNKAKIVAYRDMQVDVNGLLDEVTKNKAEIDNYTRSIIALQSVRKPDLSKFFTLEDRINTELNSIVQSKTKRTMLFEQYSKLATQDVPFSATKPDATCPYCDGELSIRGSTVAKTADMAAMKAQHDGHVAFIKQQMSALKQQMDALDLVITKEATTRALLKRLNAQRDSENKEYTNAEQKIDATKQVIKGLTDKIESIQEKITVSTAVATKIARLQGLVNASELDITNKKGAAWIATAVSDMYSPTGAPAYILDSIIDSFNDSVNIYVNLVWPNANYQLKSYKENAKGDITTKFSEELMINGKERSVGSLSGGEVRCLSLAIDFAVLDILSKQFGMAINPVIMDEPFEGLDIVSKETIIELLEKLSLDRQIWVVDHSSESKTMFSKIVRIEKRDGTSVLA